MTKRRPYQKRPASNTCLKGYQAVKANTYDVTLVVEVTRRLRLKAFDEEQAAFFAENRIRKNCKTLATHMKGTVGDVHIMFIEESNDDVSSN